MEITSDDPTGEAGISQTPLNIIYDFSPKQFANWLK